LASSGELGSVNPYVFVVGCPRSGTTLLQRMLDAHPDLAVINETLWITRQADRRKGVTREGFVTSELVSRLFEYPRFRRLDIPREEVERLLDSDDPVSYPRFVSGIFDLYGRSRGKRLVGDKSPGYVREMATLHALWPEAKFIHLIRDGRDVWLSVTGWKKADRSVGQFATWSQDPVATTALWWERSVRLGREAGASLNTTLYHEVRYEDLVADPGRECGALCDFLGLSYDEAMLRFYEGRTRDLEPGLPSKRAWLPPTPGLRDWRAQMPAEDLERFEAVAGDLLDELGYPLAGPRMQTDGEAARIRSAFTEDARARGRALPGRWRA
jgi:sulfotransferase family protein